jgi:hypothetical protein
VSTRISHSHSMYSPLIGEDCTSLDGEAGACWVRGSAHRVTSVQRMIMMGVVGDGDNTSNT